MKLVIMLVPNIGPGGGGGGGGGGGADVNVTGGFDEIEEGIDEFDETKEDVDPVDANLNLSASNS